MYVYITKDNAYKVERDHNAWRQFETQVLSHVVLSRDHPISYPKTFISEIK